MIRTVQIDDAEATARIYNHYIRHTIITFEEDEIPATEMRRRIEETQSLELPWLVAEMDGQVVGYAYASKWKGRCAYRYSVEITVYLSDESKGRGIGTALYDHLFKALKSLGYHVAIGGISLPNDASIALHEKMGMVKIGEFREVGYKFGRWIDVGYWQKVFVTEKR